MTYNDINWKQTLESLNFSEVKSMYGGYNIYDDKGIPKWQYDDEYKKERLWYFFNGMIYMRLHMELNQ